MSLETEIKKLTEQLVILNEKMDVVEITQLTPPDGKETLKVIPGAPKKKSDDPAILTVTPAIKTSADLIAYAVRKHKELGPDKAPGIGEQLRVMGYDNIGAIPAERFAEFVAAIELIK